MIDLARAKAHLKIEVDENDEDELVAAYLAAAVGHVEGATGHLLAPRQVVQRVASARVAGTIPLFSSPVHDVVAVQFVGSDGVVAALGDFRLVEGVGGALLPALGGGWPPVAEGYPAALTITYMAGYEEGEAPAALEQAVLLLVGHFHRNREAVVTGTIATSLPMSVDVLIARYRPIGIA